MTVPERMTYVEVILAGRSQKAFSNRSMDFEAWTAAGLESLFAGSTERRCVGVQRIVGGGDVTEGIPGLLYHIELIVAKAALVLKPW